MIKLGVSKRGAWERRALRLEAEHRGWWPFSYALLEELQGELDAHDEVLLERLYRSMAAGSCALKITRRERFLELDKRLSREIAHRFGNCGTIAVHDAAVSNGVTSLELFRRLSEDRPVELTATDRFDAIWIVDHPAGRWTVVFDVDANPLQIVGGGFVLPVRKQAPWRYPVNRGLQYWLRRTVLPAARARLAAVMDRESKPAMLESSGVRRVRLFHPECMREARINPSFILERHDLMEPATRRFHVVRVMNALTPGHLDEERIRTGIRACVSSLFEGGLFVLGRSSDRDEQTAHVTAYDWDGQTLKPVWCMHGGYEWPELVAVPG